MRVPTVSDLRSLAGRREQRVLTMFLPTEKAGPATRKSPIRFKNMLQQAQKRLESCEDAGALKERLARTCGSLIDNFEFWQHQSEGLAAFCGPEGCEWLQLPFAPPETLTIGTRFHIKPLLPMSARNQPFHLLALSGGHCRLYRGDMTRLEEVAVEGLPESLEDALRFEVPERVLQVHSGSGGPRGAWAGVVHGHGGMADDHKDRFSRYFRVCDHALSGTLKRDGLPLILATVDDHVPAYRDLNTYANLVEDRWVSGAPDRTPRDVLLAKAQAIVASMADEREEAALAELRDRLGTHEASVEIEKISPAIRQGKVRTAFVATDEFQPGYVDPVSGKVEMNPAADDDLLNDVAAETLAMGGDAYALPAEKIPGMTGAAAIYRF